MKIPRKSGLKLIAGIVVGLVVGTAAFAIKSDDATVYANCRFGQCHAIAKSTGHQCKHCVSNAGDLYCYEHK